MKQIPDVFDIWLKDAYMKDSLDIRHNPSYTFDVARADTNTYGANRFSLIIRSDPASNLHLLSFTAKKVFKGIETYWTVENEANYTGFNLQKSTDGVSFVTIDTLISSSAGTYSFTDAHPQNSNYYRLKLTDLTGAVSYSEVVSVMYSNTNKANNNVMVYPNPTSGPISIAVNQSSVGTAGLSAQVSTTSQLSAGTYDIKITNMTGTLLKTVTSASAIWQDNVGSLVPGTYIIQVFNHSNNKAVGRTTFVKL